MRENEEAAMQRLRRVNPVDASWLNGSAAEATGKHIFEQIVNSDMPSSTRRMAGWGPDGRIPNSWRAVSRIIMIAAVSAAVILPLIVLLPIGNGPADRSSRPSADPPELVGHGIGLTPPEGWEGRITYTTVDLGPVVQVGTFLLPSPGEEFRAEVQRALGTGDAVVTLHEFVGTCPCVGFEVANPPIRIEEGDFVSDHSTAEETNTLAGRNFALAGRYFSLWAEFGENPVDNSLLAQANDLLASLVVDEAGPGSPTSADGDVLPPPLFERAEGWYGISQATVRGSEAVPVTWATNTQLAEQDLAEAARLDVLPLEPTRTLESLDASHVVMVAWLPLPAMVPAPPGNPNFPDRTFPLRLEDAEIATSWEGKAAPSLSRRLIRARVGDQYLEVRMYFGTESPTEGVLKIAEEQLKRLVLGL